MRLDLNADPRLEPDDLALDAFRPPAGDPSRFTRRWHLVAAGLSNVWRYGDLDLDTPTGRLLLRGANGTGKTTALEALAPYLLDLNAARLAAGKARPTTLTSLMREGSDGKRRVGYAWLTFAAPAADESPAPDDVEVSGLRSWGVRLQYGPSSSPSVKVVPFTLPGRPLRDLALYGDAREALTLDDFTAAVETTGGRMFDDNEDYVADLAAHLWRGTRTDLTTVTGRLREVRNPSLLADVGPAAAATALRASLPSVAPDVIAATADALAESDTTREAFERDRKAAEVLGEFAATWTGHVLDVVGRAHAAAQQAHDDASTALAQRRGAAAALSAAETERDHAHADLEGARTELRAAETRVHELEGSEAYNQASRLTALRKELQQAKKVADIELYRFAEAAEAAAGGARARIDELTDLRQDLGRLAGDLNDAGVDLEGAAGELPAWEHRPQSTYLIRDISIDPGPKLSVHTSEDDLQSLTQTYRDASAKYARRGNIAQLAVTDHSRTVVAADTAAATARQTAKSAGEARDRAADRERTATAKADDARADLIGQVAAWIPAHGDLCACLSDEDEGTIDEPADQLTRLQAEEPGQALTSLDAWSEHVSEVATDHAGQALARAEGMRGKARQAKTHAGELCEQAAALRAGKLLPLPRPAWADPAPEGAPLVGEVLNWADGVDESHRAAVEVALADSGLLGAELNADGASTSTWSATTTGPPPPRNLTEILTVDENHPMAATAREVLARIALADTASSDADGAAEVLAVGVDGSFRAGPLVGDRLLALPGRLAPQATHVGARQRLAAALAEAEGMEKQADQLDEDAAGLERQAQEQDSAAAEVTTRARSFPSRGTLRDAEATRAVAATEAAEARAHATTLAEAADAAESRARAESVEWQERCRAGGLPVDLGELRTLAETGRATAEMLKRAADNVTQVSSPRLRRLLSAVSDHEKLLASLPELHGQAQAAQHDLEEVAERVRVLEDTANAEVATIVAKTQAAAEEVRRLRLLVPQRESDHLEAATAVTGYDRDVEHWAGECRRLEATAQTLVRRVHTLLSIQGVTGALRADGGGLAGDAASMAPELDLLEPAQLLKTVASLLRGRRTSARRTLQERYDDARAEVAGTWRVEFGSDDEDLSTYVLTHNDETYTPLAAATFAAQVADGAQAALAEAEDSALRNFIIGRLPTAIGVAWLRLDDWKREVNRKMKAASASSGVGVQVGIRLSRDLNPSVRTVHDLSCGVATADRTLDQERAVGEAIRSLIAAADGETMADKVAAAVDIRDWVDVWYIVHRPGQDPRPWTSKTGLSGGERRLVVLAPMLAAVAAGYDSLHPSGLRLVALDEVPAEVDEAGREGLARYIAALDLDLMCTSYLWDGAPGAWDGIDAWDFEADGAGTVVAFPMQVRGLDDMPDDSFTGLLWPAEPGAPADGSDEPATDRETQP